MADVSSSSTLHGYHFVTEWRFPSTSAEEVWEILADPLQLPRWWPAVYLSVRNSADMPGVYELHTRGRLPYTLRWSMRRSGERKYEAIRVEAWGDLTGAGEWTFAPQAGGHLLVRYEWRVRADKPLLRRLSWLLKPVFEANHRWAMARGEESLRKELELRRRIPVR